MSNFDVMAPKPPRGSQSLVGISKAEILSRQERARTIAIERGLDGLLLVSRSFYDRPGSVAYLSDHHPPFPTAVFTDGARGFGHALLLLPVDGGATLLTDIRGHRADLVPIDDCRAVGDLGQALIDLLTSRGLTHARLAVEDAEILPWPFVRAVMSALPQLTLLDDVSIVSNLRRIKSPTELDLLREAGRCADIGLTAAIARLRERNATERVISAAGSGACLAEGADFVRYFRVHSGEWSATGSRWPPATERAVQPGDIVVMDAIGAVAGYGFDVNRTVALEPLSERQRAFLEAGHAATKAAVDACRVGATVSDLVFAARKSLAKTPFEDALGPVIGHGIGLETVELPLLRADDRTMLEPNMVLCVEPSLTVPGQMGVAIEQTVIIRESGPPEIITPTPTRLW